MIHPDPPRPDDSSGGRLKYCHYQCYNTPRPYRKARNKSFCQRCQSWILKGADIKIGPENVGWVHAHCDAVPVNSTAALSQAHGAPVHQPTALTRQAMLTNALVITDNVGLSASTAIMANQTLSFETQRHSSSSASEPAPFSSTSTNNAVSTPTLKRPANEDIEPDACAKRSNTTSSSGTDPLTISSQNTSATSEGAAIVAFNNLLHDTQDSQDSQTSSVDNRTPPNISSNASMHVSPTLSLTSDHTTPPSVNTLTPTSVRSAYASTNIASHSIAPIEIDLEHSKPVAPSYSVEAATTTESASNNIPAQNVRQSSRLLARRDGPMNGEIPMPGIKDSESNGNAP